MECYSYRAAYKLSFLLLWKSAGQFSGPKQSTSRFLNKELI